jgi:hypothetical protein
MDIKELYEKTELTQAQIGAQLGLTQQQVSNKIKRLFSSEFRKTRKAVCYRNSKTGNKNPMYQKLSEQHHNFIGVVSDNKGYWMQLKPSWYTGRKKSKHVFVHHVVICEHLQLTSIPKGWCVHHCDFNPENNSINNLVLLTLGDHQRLHRYLEGVTTISKESTLNWVETHGTPFRRDDIV